MGLAKRKIPAYLNDEKKDKSFWVFKIYNVLFLWNDVQTPRDVGKSQLISNWKLLKFLSTHHWSPFDVIWTVRPNDLVAGSIILSLPWAEEKKNYYYPVGRKLKLHVLYATTRIYFNLAILAADEFILYRFNSIISTLTSSWLLQFDLILMPVQG